MEQIFQQTLSFNFNNVPVHFNLSSSQPLPENLVTSTVRSLVRNATAAVGVDTTATANNQQTTSSQSNPTTPTQSSPASPLIMPTGDSPPTTPVLTTEIQGESLSTEQPTEGDTQLIPVETSHSQQNANTNSNNFEALIKRFLPEMLKSIARILIVLYIKYLFYPLIDVALAIGLAASFFASEELIKRIVFSDQALLSQNNRNILLAHSAAVSGAMALAFMLFSCPNIFNLLIFNIDPSAWNFGGLLNTLMIVFTLNYVIKNCVVLCKLATCLIVGRDHSPLSRPKIINILNCFDVFGHLYLCITVAFLWYIYLGWLEGPYWIGKIVFICYIGSRGPHVFMILKFCWMAISKLPANRTYGREATQEEIEKAERCSICIQEGFRLPTVVSCSHVFCHSCIAHWLVEKPTCPVCRQRLQTGIDAINFPVVRYIFYFM